LPVTLFNIPHDPEFVDLALNAGVEQCVLYIYDDGPGTIQTQLDAHTRFIHRFVEQ
jgi:hypothetical protein